MAQGCGSRAAHVVERHRRATVEQRTHLGGQQQGPVPFDRLKELFAARTINRDTLIWKQGLDGWTPLSEVAELKSFLGGNTPPPLPGA